MKAHSRSISFVAAALALGASLAPHAFAQYPSRPVRFVVPFPPGGLADYVTRLIAPQLTQSLGQQVFPRARCPS
jgi:tripartite-type tricarboxylate transporter receptor subunit TctC